MVTSPEQAGRQKVAIVVLGMHRSGTSAMTRVLSLAGAKLPAVPLPPGPDNIDGHWEPLEVVTLNEKILASVDSSWSDTFGPRGYRAKPPSFDQHLDEACEVLRRNYNGETFIVIKEPRISLLLGLWTSALKREGFQPVFVIMVRHPIEVAESLKVRNGFIREKSLMLWTTYMLAAELGTRREKRVFVSYDDLLADPEATLDAIESALMLQLPKRSWEATLDIQEYIRPERRHHNAGGRKLNLNSLSSIERLYAYFEAAISGQPWNANVADEIGAWLSNIEDTAGVLIKSEERQRRAATEDAERWAKRTDEAYRRLEAVKAEQADIVRDRDNRETQFRVALAEREESHRARLAELEQAQRHSDHARNEQFESMLTARETAHRAQLAALEEARQAEREIALAERDDAHRVRVAELEAALLAAERARMMEWEAKETLRKEQAKALGERDDAHQKRIAEVQRRAAAEAYKLSAAFAASESEREIHAGQMRDALRKAEDKLQTIDSELTAARKAVERAEARNIALANEAKTFHDQSAELANALTSVITDRSRISSYSALELQLAALRRLWPFR